MELTSQQEWHHRLADPTGRRKLKPRADGKTMVLDKGLGLHAFQDLLQTCGEHIDVIKLGFGTAALYPPQILRRKIEWADAAHIEVMPGGTFLEVAVIQGVSDHFLNTVATLGFSSVEISDGTIDLDRRTRNELIRKAKELGLRVHTEYGKKLWGSTVHLEELLETIHIDLAHGAETVTVEGRESGAGVGIYDEDGECNTEHILQIVRRLSDPANVLWETPQKNQQVFFIETLGPDVNLGNIAPGDVLSLEALRRGLRSDTFRLAESHMTLF